MSFQVNVNLIPTFGSAVSGLSSVLTRPAAYAAAKKIDPAVLPFSHG